MRQVYEVKCIRAGQPRPYADSVYEYELQLYVEDFKDKKLVVRDISDPNAIESIVKPIARLLCKDWADKPEWYQCRLQSFSRIDKGKYRLVVIDPYKD